MFHLYASTYIDSICTVLILSVIKLSISLNHHLLIYIYSLLQLFALKEMLKYQHDVHETKKSPACLLLNLLYYFQAL